MAEGELGHPFQIPSSTSSVTIQKGFGISALVLWCLSVLPLAKNLTSPVAQAGLELYITLIGYDDDALDPTLESTPWGATFRYLGKSICLSGLKPLSAQSG